MQDTGLKWAIQIFLPSSARLTNAGGTNEAKSSVITRDEKNLFTPIMCCLTVRGSCPKTQKYGILLRKF